MTATGLADLYSTMAPRLEEPVPPPDLDAIRDAGWQAGFAAGEAEAAERLTPLRAGLAAAVTAIDRAMQIDPDRLRPLFAALVERIAAAVLMAELTSGARMLLPLVDAALAQVRVDEPITLCAHPDTLAGLIAHLPAMATAADADMATDAFRITGPTFVIETGVAARLAALAEQLA